MKAVAWDGTFGHEPIGAVGVVRREITHVTVINGARVEAGAACTGLGILCTGAAAGKDPGYTVRSQRAGMEASP
jgi:hypothetical protein